MNMIADGLVHIVASDAHRPRGRSPSLIDAVKAIQRHFNDDICNILFSANPLRLLNGEDLNSLPVNAFQKKTRSAKKKKRSLIKWLNNL